MIANPPKRWDVISAHVSYAEDATKGKLRPAIYVDTAEGVTLILTCTTKFDDKTQYFKDRLYKIMDLESAGLKEDTWIYSHTLKEIVHYEPSEYDVRGHLSDEDLFGLDRYLERYLES